MPTAMITGASSGIGRELAILFAKKKYNLLLLARSEEKLKNLKKELEENYSIICNLIFYDLSNIDKEKIKEMENIIKEYDLDILINCAGFGAITNFYDLSLEEDLKMLNVNLNSAIILSRLFLEKALEINKGNLINICSTAALYYHPYMTTYSTTKRALLNYSLSLSEELKNTNIRVISICPGPTASPFFDDSVKEKFKSFKMWEMSTESVAREIISAYDRRKKFVIVGLRNKLLTKLINILPINLQLKLVAKHLRKVVRKSN